MSKKKNTLKDLDEFLKQQAATLVSPNTLDGQVEIKVSKIEEATPAAEPVSSLTADKILEDLKALSKSEAPAFRKKLYSLIIQSLEAQPQSLPEDKMLINTALYLQSGDQWKEVIREYWRNKP